MALIVIDERMLLGKQFVSNKDYSADFLKDRKSKSFNNIFSLVRKRTGSYYVGTYH